MIAGYLFIIMYHMLSRSHSLFPSNSQKVLSSVILCDVKQSF